MRKNNQRNLSDHLVALIVSLAWAFCGSYVPKWTLFRNLLFVRRVSFLCAVSGEHLQLLTKWEKEVNTTWKKHSF